ncbi:sodium- and chloride-dependent glycine transporter 2-like [Gigantopelta aegis]|uniref:sodium- and chloride-dependent glycine transporter 2-like n=1 Tax=Gigantopelta aegis TaxID=1735272 RepID=UPI001B88ABD8|nr:sodium- and chloride-dependent glycine transporter 2-like [Gigantopelta aegis]
MIGKKVPVFFEVCLTYVTPLVLLVSMVFKLAQYTLTTYGKYEYPHYSAVIGWIYAAIPVTPIPVFFIWELAKAEGPMRAVSQSISRRLVLVCSKTDLKGVKGNISVQF